MKNKKMIIILSTIVAIIVCVIVIVLATTGGKSEERMKVGLILSGAKDEQGWNGMHYEGVRAACEKMNISLLVKENVKEFTGDCVTAAEELVKEGADMIILSSYNYSEEMYTCVKKYPDVAFYGNSSEYHEKNMTSYFARMYQARYLSGILAGMRSENGKVGYVAAMANNEVNRGISAFAMGVRSVNPDARVVVAWSNSWDDATKEADCAKKLIEESKVDVITYHQNGATVLDTADAKGIASIGYHQPYEGYTDQYLTSVVCYWDKVYTELIKEVMAGEPNSKENAWIGLSEDAVGLSELSIVVSEEEKKALEEAKNKILAGQDVFSGLIYDTENEVRCNEGEMISDKELLENFDWYVMGVEFYEE